MCDIDNCSIKLNSKHSLRKHVRKWHFGKRWKVPVAWYSLSQEPSTSSSSCLQSETFLVDDVVEANSFQANDPTMDEMASDDEVIDSLNDSPETFDIDVDVQEFSSRQIDMALSLAKLKADCNMNESALQIVQRWTEDLLEYQMKYVIESLKSCKSFSVTEEIENVFEIGMGLANPFHGVQNEYCRKKLLPCFVVCWFQLFANKNCNQ